jgi:hypothetical protein
MNTTTIKDIEPIRRQEAMDVLWGAWVKRVRFNEKQRSTDILGIYDEIWAEGKGDFPLITDLHLVLALNVANTAEIGQTYEITLDFADGYGVYHPFKTTYQIAVPEGDLPMRWYEPYTFHNVLIREPDHYFLNVSIERQFKLSVSLWVIAPKAMMYDPEKDSTTEFWPEDWDEFFNKGEQ